MRSLTSLHESRVYSPENFWSPVQKDFCNNICQNRTHAPQQVGPNSSTAAVQAAFRSWPSLPISRPAPAHEVGHGMAKLLGAILLEEMAPFHRHFGLVQPGAATFPLPADQNRTWIRIDEKLRDIGF